MELDNSNGAKVPKKSRSLDLKTLYKSSVSKDSLNKSLKRKNSSGEGDDQQKQDKRSKKVVSLNSFEKLDSDNRKGVERESNGDLSLHDLEDSKPCNSQKVGDCSEYHGMSPGFSSSSVYIPRRRRGFVGRNKFESRHVLDPAEKLTDKEVLIDLIPQSVDEECKSKIHKVGKAKGSDSCEETRESGSSIHLKRGERHSNHSAADRGELALETLKKNPRKRKGHASNGRSLEKDTKLLAEAPCTNPEGLREDDEENLEANAARMLSSRFDTSCTGFSSSSVGRIPSLSFSGRNSSVIGAKSSKHKSTLVDMDDRKLRPRKNLKEHGTTRKRRHFYELLFSDVDSCWLLNKKIKVYWPLDENWYHGLVDDYDKERQLHHVKYDDRDEEWVNLQGERFKILLLPAEVPGKCERKKHQPTAKSIDNVKRNTKFGKFEENENMAIEDDSAMENMEYEPIITWLSRSAHRVKSSILRSVKKQKTTATSSSNELPKADGAPDKTKTCSVSLPACALVDGRKGNEPTSSSPSYGKGSQLPLVYFRRRIGRTKQATVQVSKGAIKVRSQHDVSRCSDPDVDFWPVDVSGSVELFIPWMQSKQFEFYLDAKVVSVFNYAFPTEPVWLLNTGYVFNHGTLMAIWPRVRLETLFLDNITGLRYLFFEGCLVEAVEFIFWLLTVFHQSDDQGKFIDLRLPLSSIGFRLSSIPKFRRKFSFAFCNILEVKSSRWAYLERKINKYSMLSKQLILSECPYLNSKELQNRQSHNTSAHGNIASAEGIQNQSGQDFWPMLFLREPSIAKAWPSSVSDKKHQPINSVALPVARMDLLSLHVKTIMEHISRKVNFLDNSTSAFQEDVIRNEQTSSPEKSLNDVPYVSPSSPLESQEIDDGTSYLKCQYKKSKSENCKLSSADRMKINGGSDHPVNGTRIGIQLSTDLPLNMQGSIIPSTNPTAPRSTWHRSRSSSSSLGYLTHGWFDGKRDFLNANFGRGPKKPRTQVSYLLPSVACDSRNKSHLQKGVPHKRIRRSSDRRSADVSRGPRKDLESSFCDANVLVTIGDRGWRVCGARVVLEPFDDNEWKLAVKISGTTRYSYKAHQFLQPGSTNRYTHAMMWKGGKDWGLEFPNRSQWLLFKEMHEECLNRNLRAASIRNIPIPGVRLIEENNENGTNVVFAHNSSKYFRQTENDVEMALDTSRVLYDMDSDDEQWLSELQSCPGAVSGSLFEVTEEMFEKVMNMFEKAAYVQQRDRFTSNEIEELLAGAGPIEVIQRIYEHWRTKRQRLGMPLIRHLQPPLWQRYQQQLKDWELAMTRTNSFSGTHGKGTLIEKPAMFAFCLKPRGLEVPNKGSKHRSQKKISVYLGDQEGYYTYGRRSSGFTSGDEKFLYSGYNYDYLEDFSLHPISPRVFSPRDSGMKYFSMSNNGCDRNQSWYQRSKSKKVGFFAYGGDTSPRTPYNQRSAGKKNRTDPWNTSHPDWSAPYSNPEELVGSDLEEFRLHDAGRAAKRARATANHKRERAKKLHYKADVAIQKAVSALMIAEAFKASFDDT